MRAAPDLDWRMDCVPVDDAARAIVRLALAHDAGSSVHHVIAARPRHWRECVLWMRLRGYDVDLLPYAEWAERLRPRRRREQSAVPAAIVLSPAHRGEDELTLPELFEESRRSSVNGECSWRARRPRCAYSATWTRGYYRGTSTISFARASCRMLAPRWRLTLERTGAWAPRAERGAGNGLSDWLDESAAAWDRFDLTPWRATRASSPS